LPPYESGSTTVFPNLSLTGRFLPDTGNSSSIPISEIVRLLTTCTQKIKVKKLKLIHSEALKGRENIKAIQGTDNPC
jgi:hypothetical protein